MSRIRRYLPPLLILLPMIFICGKLLLTPVTIDDDPGFTVTGRGWPWEFSVAGEHFDQQLNATWPAWTPYSEFSWWLLLADVVVHSAAIAAAWFALLWCWRRAGYRFRFSSRTGLLLVLILALPLGWWMSHVKSWRDEQRLWQECHDFAQFDSARYRGPRWLERLWPRDELTIFVRASNILVGRNLDEREAAALLSAIENLPYVNSLHCAYCVVRPADTADERVLPLITPSSVPGPSKLSHLEVISLDCDESGAVTPDTLQVLGKLPRLKDLSLVGCPGAGAGLKYLKHSYALERLNLFNTKTTDEEVAQLADLSNLKMLDVSYTSITFHAIESIVKLHSLTELRLRGLRSFTGHNLLRLLELPNLTRLDVADLLDNSEQTHQMVSKLFDVLHERHNKLAPPDSETD